MSTVSSVKAEKRQLTSTKFRKQNRDLVPGVMYGKKVAPQSIAIDKLSLSRVYSRIGQSSVFEVDIEGSKTAVLLHDVQFHPSSNAIIHFDLYAVTKDEKLKTDVPIHFEGEAPAQTDADKVITTIVDSVEVEALPMDLPEHLVVDITTLTEVGEAKHVSDIIPIDKVEVTADPEVVLIKVEAVQEEAEPEPEETEEPEDGESDASAEGQSDDSAGGDEAAAEETSKD